MNTISNVVVALTCEHCLQCVQLQLKLLNRNLKIYISNDICF
jgi:hypothetical protein